MMHDNLHYSIDNQVETAVYCDTNYRLIDLNKTNTLLMVIPISSLQSALATYLPTMMIISQGNNICYPWGVHALHTIYLDKWF